MNTRSILACVVLGLTASASFSGEFTGPLVYDDAWYLDDGSFTYATHPKRMKKVKVGFGYTDNSALNWEVTAGQLTDGASIPWYVRWLIGDKFLPEFARPSAVHDHYVTDAHRVRPARATHRMFRDALEDEHVKDWKVRAMYTAVAVFGPSWTDKEIVTGQECELFDDCVRSSEDDYASVDYIVAIEPTEAQRAELEALLAEFKAADDVSFAEMERAAIELRQRLDIPLGSLADVLE